MRAGAYSWHSSAKAAARLKAARGEIRAVARSEPVIAGEGVVALAERIWPAFEYIDTSSGALGNAVAKTLDALLPVLIDAPADEKTRAKWLERIRMAIEADGMDYLSPIAACFGEIAAYPALMDLHADRELDCLRHAWSQRDRYVYFPAANLTLSWLLEAGRYEELFDLLALKDTLRWFDGVRAAGNECHAISTGGEPAGECCAVARPNAIDDTNGMLIAHRALRSKRLKKRSLSAPSMMRG